jgi:hypothetical protein
MSRTIRVSRQFAVWLEDCVEMEVPDDLTDAELDDNIHDIFATAFDKAKYGSPASDEVLSACLLWEDEHQGEVGLSDSYGWSES